MIQQRRWAWSAHDPGNGEHDGFGHHHAAGEHGTDRRGVASVLACHGSGLDGAELHRQSSVMDS